MMSEGKEKSINGDDGRRRIRDFTPRGQP